MGFLKKLFGGKGDATEPMPPSNPSIKDIKQQKKVNKDALSADQLLRPLKNEVNKQYTTAQSMADMEGVTDIMLKTKRRVEKMEAHMAENAVLRVRVGEIDEKLSDMASQATEALQKCWPHTLSFAMDGLEQGVLECRAEIPLHDQKNSNDIVTKRLELLEQYETGISLCKTIDQQTRQLEDAKEREEKAKEEIQTYNELLDDYGALTKVMRKKRADEPGYIPADDNERAVWRYLDDLDTVEQKRKKASEEYSKASDLVRTSKEALQGVWSLIHSLGMDLDIKMEEKLEKVFQKVVLQEAKIQELTDVMAKFAKEMRSLTKGYKRASGVDELNMMAEEDRRAKEKQAEDNRREAERLELEEKKKHSNSHKPRLTN